MNLRESLNIYVNTQENRNVSAKTLKKLNMEVNVFCRWMEENSMDFTQMKAFNIVQYLADTVAIGKAGTYNDRRGYLNRFYKFFLGNEITKNNPVKSVERAIKPKQDDEIKAIDADNTLLQQLVNDRYGNCHYYRNIAICTIALEMGLRREELANLEIKKFDFEKNTFTFLRKNRKYQTLHLPTESKKAITEYIDKERPDNGSTSLFLSKSKSKITADSMGNLVSNLLTKAGYEDFTAHSLRHRCITDWLQILKLDLKTVSILAGHSSIEITARYLHSSEDEANDKLEEAYNSMKGDL